jgi:WD40 repeat protein
MANVAASNRVVVAATEGRRRAKFAAQMEHQSNVEGLGDFAWHPSGGHLLSCGADSQIRVFDKDMNVQNTIEFHQAPVHCLAISPKGDVFASGGKDQQVVLFTYPDCKFESIVTRLDVSIYHVAFDPHGTWLAVCGDSSQIKLVNLIDTNQMSVLSGHVGSVKSLAFDPQGAFLASAGCQGVLHIWSLSSRSSVFTSPHFPKSEIESSTQMLRLSWHPDGTLLALPGQDEIVCLMRDSWTPGCILRGSHTKRVSITAWSKNGAYLASVDEGGKVVIWLVAAASPRVVATLDLDASCTAMNWDIAANALTLLTAEGNLKHWDKPVPETGVDALSLPMPFGSVVRIEPNSSKKAVRKNVVVDKAELVSAIDVSKLTPVQADDEDDIPESVNGSTDGNDAAADNSDDESAAAPKRRLRRGGKSLPVVARNEANQQTGVHSYIFLRILSVDFRVNIYIVIVLRMF